jgi:hypothetical protein
MSGANKTAPPVTTIHATTRESEFGRPIPILVAPNSNREDSLAEAIVSPNQIFPLAWFIGPTQPSALFGWMIPPIRMLPTGRASYQLVLAS